MILLGEKVILRAIELSDKDILRELINDCETEYLLGGRSFPISELHQEEWIMSLKPNNHTLRCMIDNNQDKKTIGTVILSDIDYINGTAEIHIKLVKGYRGKGFGADTIRAVVKYSFQELRLQCIYAYINDYNKGSCVLFNKLGFQQEGKVRSRIYKNGTYHDKYIYSILVEDWYGNRK